MDIHILNMNIQYIDQPYNRTLESKSTMVVVGVRGVAGRIVDMVVGNVLGAGALMVFTVSGVDVVEA